MPSFVRIETVIRFIELLLFIGLCVLAMRWLTTIFAGAPLPVPPPANAGSSEPGDRAAEMLASARLFGSHPPGSLSENVQALGVIADAAGAGSGSALISVDGHPARAYRIGSDVEGRRLTAIRADEIELESSGSRQLFRLPPRGAAAAGIGPAR